MKTKTILFLQKLFLIFFASQLLGSCAYNETFAQRGSGVKATEQRNAGNFTKLDVSSAFEVTLSQGTKAELIIEADDNLLSEIATVVSGGRLSIYVKDRVKPITKMKIYLTFVSLDDIELSGAVKLHSEEVMSFDRLNLGLSGASSIDLEGNFQKLNVDLSGASGLKLSGQAESAFLESSGASNLALLNLSVRKMKLDLSGASNADVWATESLRVEASGASKVKYKGNPQLTVNTSGASTVKKF